MEKWSSFVYLVSDPGNANYATWNYYVHRKIQFVCKIIVIKNDNNNDIIKLLCSSKSSVCVQNNCD